MSDDLWSQGIKDSSTLCVLEQWRCALVVMMLSAVHLEVVPALGTNIDPLVEFVLDHPVSIHPREHPIPWFPRQLRHALRFVAEHVVQPPLLLRLWAFITEG